LLKKGIPNYNEWESHCLKLAQGNRYVLDYLMAVSQLRTHPVGLYYREAVKHVLKVGETDLVTRSLPESWMTPYDTRIKALCKQALDLRENSIQAATAQLRQGEYGLKESQLPKIVGERLAYFYSACSTPGIISTDKLQDEALKTVLDSNWSEAILDDHASYYQHQFDMMMLKNQAAVTKE
jgi:hypothetical protein